MAGPSDESRQELVRLLAEARQAKNLSIRACAKLAGVPAATAQGWLNGRHLPTPALRDNFEQLLRALELDIPKSSWRPETRSSAEADPAARAPYLGLRSYGRADADLFWGRDAQAKRLAELIADMPDRRGIVALVGGSGSGKSSLLAAGLVAGECSSGILAGWRAVLMPVDALTTETQAELVVIDQFEELLTGDPDRLSAALDTVESLAASSCVVIGLRSDAYAAAALQPALMSALERPVLISEMTRDELTEAIVRPAEAVGVNVEPELVRAFLDDLAPRGVRGALVTQALPLLSSALLATWVVAERNRMTVADYHRIGGLGAAVENLAEDVFANLSEPDQRAAKGLFLDLISLNEGGVVRVRLSKAALPPAKAVIAEQFIESRLLTSSNDQLAISHDALLLHWPRLATWVNEEREALRVREQLRRATALWLANDRHVGSLLAVEELPFFASVVSDPELEQRVSGEEREFLAQSRAHFASELDAERKVSARLRGQRRLALLLAVLTTVAVIVAVVTLNHARSVQLEAQSRQLAYQVRSMSSGDTFLQGQIALASASLADTVEGRSVLLDTYAGELPQRWVGDGPSVLASSGDGQVVVRADSLGQVTLWRGDELTTGPGKTFTVNPAGQALFAAAVYATGGRLILAVGGLEHASIWDITADPALLTEMPVGETTVYALAFRSTDGVLAIGDSAGTINFFAMSDPSAPEPLDEVVIGGPVSAVVFDPTRPEVYASGQAGVISRWVWSANRLVELPGFGFELSDRIPRAQSLAMSPDGRWLVAAAAGRATVRWDLMDAEPLPVVNTAFASWVNSVRFIDNGRYITADSNQVVQIFDAATDRLERSLSGPSVMTDAQVIGGKPVAVDTAGTLRIWKSDSALLRPAGATIYQFASDLRGEKWLAGLPLSDNEVLLWSLVDGVKAVAAPRLPADVALSSAVQVAPDGSRLWAGTRSGEVISWPLTAAGAGDPVRHPVVAGGGWVNVVVDPAGKYLLVSADDSSGQAISKLISVSPDGDLAELAVIDAEGPQMPYFSADSSLLAIGLIDDEVGVWSLAEPASPTRVSTIQTDSLPTATVWSPTGALLAIGTDLGTVTIWDAADPAEPKLVRGFDEAQAAIYAMAFTPDGDRLLGAGGDEVFFVWNLTGQSATAEYVLGSGVGRTTEVRTIHNGASFVGAGNDGSVRVWELELARVRDQICATRGTPLSDVEWSQYIHGLAPFDPCR